MTSHSDSHNTTDVKPEIIPGVQTGNEFHRINIIFAALPMHAQTKKTTFSCKDDYTLTNYTRRWTYSALLYFW